MTMTERLANFETAQETLGMMIAMRSKWIFDEKQKPFPDQNLIEKWENESFEFGIEDDVLSLYDEDGIERVISTYGPIVRAEFDKI